jgi:hypothetical protein
LSGGQIDGGHVREPIQADGGKGGVGLLRVTAQKRRPEAEILPHRQRRLQCVLMSEIVRLLADGQFQIAALELDPALLRLHKASDQAQ